VTDPHFECSSCLSDFLVEGSVPLLLKPDDIVSIPDEVIRTFNISPEFKARVETALTPLIKYRTSSSRRRVGNGFRRFIRERHGAAIGFFPGPGVMIGEIVGTER
jgi:hypothetical protein